MTNSAIASQLIDALAATADREAGAKTWLVSINVDMLAHADAGAIDITVTRKTRTLIFLRADFNSKAGALIASASSIHKLAT